MNYEELSDFEINKRVAKSKKLKGTHQQNGVAVSCYHGYFDPCNNPADAWPVIIGNKISLYSSHEDKWFARSEYSDNLLNYGYRCWDENPLRAAMICYLMMQEAK